MLFRTGTIRLCSRALGQAKSCRRKAAANRISAVEPPKSNFKNLILTIVLAVLVLAVAYESAKRGVFPLKREQVPVALNGEPSPPVESVEPTPTPLPMHFPELETDDLRDSKRTAMGLVEAFKSCWPKAPIMGEPDTNGLAAGMTLANVEKLFGKVKKREVLEVHDASRRLGLLFDTAVFPAGAAGSATEDDDTLRDLQVRASGRMLHCDNAERCECLSSIGP
ncbi:hypothetical protein BH10BDE1_BH10BDE1_25400 [soil metagenome]